MVCRRPLAMPARRRFVTLLIVDLPLHLAGFLLGDWYLFRSHCPGNLCLPVRSTPDLLAAQNRRLVVLLVGLLNGLLVVNLSA